jgi:hypothetical protein
MTEQHNDGQDEGNATQRAGGMPAPAGADTALARAGEQDVAELKQQMSHFIDSPDFLPVLGSFREVLEAERERSRRRFVGLTALFGVLLLAAVLVPLQVGQRMQQRTDAASEAQQAALTDMRRRLDDRLDMLAAASAEMQQALDEQHVLLLQLSGTLSGLGASRAVESPAAPASAPGPAPTATPPAPRPAVPRRAAETGPVRPAAAGGATNVPAAVTPRALLPQKSVGRPATVLREATYIRCCWRMAEYSLRPMNRPRCL